MSTSVARFVDLDCSSKFVGIVPTLPQIRVTLQPPLTVTKSRLLPRTLRQLDSPLQVTSSHRSNRQTQRLSMKPVLFFVALSASAASAVDEDINHRRTRAKASKENTGTKTTKTLVLDILNESFNQPFSPFFVMVHNCEFQILACAQLSSTSSLLTCHSSCHSRC